MAPFPGDQATPATITVLAQNITKNNLDAWPVIAERIRAHHPDLVCLSELPDSHTEFAAIAASLGLASPGLAPSRSGVRTAVLYNPTTLGTHIGWETEYAHKTHHGFGVATFELGLPYPLAVTSVHLDPFAIDWARAEASLIGCRARRHGPLAIIAGDINYSPAHGPEPDFDAMGDWNLNQRTILTDPELGLDPIADRSVAWRIKRSGFVDVAEALHNTTSDDNLLAFTGGHERVDQIWVSRPFLNCIAAYRLITHPDTATNHNGVLAVITLAALHISDRDRAGHW
ncbi:endonuclease/exonuclease/phosphatase family protein [Actinokineospora sp.]|uniref:endonuclease/exonuclease/phosphatase family protein n=1 Tax=Actinokineospora sp. TaxID=1872133 RepID=UPI0040380B30